MAKKAGRKLSDLSISRRPESSAEVKGGKTTYTLGTATTSKSAGARAKARRSRPD